MQINKLLKIKVLLFTICIVSCLTLLIWYHLQIDQGDQILAAEKLLYEEANRSMQVDRDKLDLLVEAREIAENLERINKDFGMIYFIAFGVCYSSFAYYLKFL